jgi:hypothetical protein
MSARLNSGIGQQHRRRLFRRTRHRRIVSYQNLRDRSIDEKCELRRQVICIRDAKLYQQIAEPDAAAFLEGNGDFFDGLICAAQFGNSVDERAAAKTPAGDAPLQKIERTENLFGGRPAPISSAACSSSSSPPICRPILRSAVWTRC